MDSFVASQNMFMNYVEPDRRVSMCILILVYVNPVWHKALLKSHTTQIFEQKLPSRLLCFNPLYTG